jgi:hypothetical protein
VAVSALGGCLRVDGDIGYVWYCSRDGCGKRVDENAGDDGTAAVEYSYLLQGVDTVHKRVTCWVLNRTGKIIQREELERTGTTRWPSCLAIGIGRRPLFCPPNQHSKERPGSLAEQLQAAVSNGACASSPYLSYVCIPTPWFAKLSKQHPNCPGKPGSPCNPASNLYINLD